MPSEPPLPPAQPSYILRGHKAQIHALTFYASNLRLLSADADGYIISWDLLTKRPVAGWRAHQKAVLGIAAWGPETLISHGRDSRLVVWRLDRETEKLMHQFVPADQLDSSTAKPAMLQEMTVNTMNFCAFAWCEAPVDMLFADVSLGSEVGGTASGVGNPVKPILLAVPNTLDSESIDIFYMPAARRKSTINAPKELATGMAMSLLISARDCLTVAAGYESGDLIVYQHDIPSDSWKIMYKTRAHSQPILSLCVHPELRVCISSSADGIIAKHPFANPDLLAESKDKPVKLVQTRHSGQQGLSMRSDGRIFSTAGWDSRIRIYSAKTMKEVAVLKHHRQGCYETALADVSESLDSKDAQASNEDVNGKADNDEGVDATGSGIGQVAAGAPQKSLVMSRFEEKIRSAHWLAAGSKDGNISLWDVF